MLKTAKNFGFMQRPGTWWGVDEWLNSHRPKPGGILDPEEWHYGFMRGGPYLAALYGPSHWHGPSGWVARLRTSLAGVEYWAYVPNGGKDLTFEWHTVHSSGLVTRLPPKKHSLGVKRLVSMLPTNGGEVVLAAELERRVCIEAGVWAWWVAQVMPFKFAREHLPWVTSHEAHATIAIRSIRESAVEMAARLRGENYARYAYRITLALQALRKKHPQYFYEI